MLTVTQKKCKTQFIKEAIKNDEALNYFLILRDSVDWEEGIRSKNGFTRKAKSIDFTDYPFIYELILSALELIVKDNTKYLIRGVYLNYYETPEMFTPGHSHKQSHQLVISLGGARNLNVGKKNYLKVT